MEPIIQFKKSTNTSVDTYELEARFGHQLTKLDYNHVIQWLLLSGFELEEPDGKDMLRIGYKKTTENIRIEINGIKSIQRYCKTQQLVNPIFGKKKQLSRHELPQYWTTIALSLESTMTEAEQSVSSMTPTSFRVMNRVRLISKDYTFVYDCSIVRTSDSLATLFTKDPSYEIEVEFMDKKVELEKAITFALRGLQQSYYPIPLSEMNTVRGEYKKQISTGLFIGPNLVTLQEENLHGNMSIYKNHAVTDKADGERKLLFVCNEKIYYLVGSSLQVQWTGSKAEKNLNGTLLDGEHVVLSKNRERMNAYFAFDIYFHVFKKINDVRAEPFIVSDDRDNRYSRLMDAVKKLTVNTFQLSFKNFMPCTHKSCEEILEKAKEKEGFPYHIDGLILTPMEYGVGMTETDKTIKDKQITWDLNFKWKPSDENTIDFLIQFEDKEHIYTDPANPFTYKIVNLFVQFGSFDVDANPLQSIFQGFEVHPPRESSHVLFKPSEPLNEIGGPMDEYSHVAYIPSMDGIIHSELREVLETNMIVECRYDKSKANGCRWIPMRVRWDKMKNRNPNAFRTAASNWYMIHKPITELMLTKPYQIQQYYEENKERSHLRDFHNYVKTQVLSIIKEKQIVLDFAVGRGGDLFKWKKASFVLGIDIDENNIINKKWGACKRYLEAWKTGYKTRALFLQGDSTFRIKTGDAMRGLKEKAIVRSIFGVDPKRPLAKGVDVHYGKGLNGFHVTSIQFAIHYMFGNKKNLSHFLQNVAECTAMHGYFVGTCYDGISVFSKLKDKREGESYTIKDKETICTIRKKYNVMDVDMNDSCLGYKIGVKQTSIGSEHDEYLVFFPYFVNVMKDYGFELIEVKPFQKWFDDWGKTMTEGEKELSFLNQSFVFQKKHNVLLATKEYYLTI
jgi:hypothetical protein